MSTTSNSQNDTKYRYYHCVMGTYGDWSCEERNSLSVPVGNEISKALTVCKYVPKIDASSLV